MQAHNPNYTMQGANPPRLLTIPQIARTGLLPESTLRQMLRQGLLPAIRIRSRTYINYSLLMDMLANLGPEGPHE